MIQQTLSAIGLNPSLIMDIGAVVLATQTAFIFLTLTALKGVVVPILRAKYKKENLALIDLGGIETPLINYPRGAVELLYNHKDNKYSWPIPDDIERMLPNGVRYIMASRSEGSAYNTSIIGKNITDIRRLLSPKGQANTIDDRSKQIADKKLGNINKPVVIAGAVAILFIVGLFGYLIFTKAAEYDICRNAIEIAKTTTATTLPHLKDLT